ncbi:hypothetical protein HG530_012292 [Fusarium avenaceum]|nr:hypothetical protein HG530_012292 [Fusarium avenaceum]
MNSFLFDVLGDGLHDTILGDELHGLGHFIQEALVTSQIVTEEFLDTEDGTGVLATLLSQSLQLLAHGVIDLELVALVVNSVDVDEPTSSNETQTSEGASTPDVLGDGRHDELRDLAGGVEGDTGNLVHDGGVGETLHQGVTVLVDIDTRDVGQKGLDLLLHHLPDKLAVDGVLHNLVDVLEASKLSWVSHGGVTGVEKAKLVLLELLDIVNVMDDLDTDLLEGRAAVGELVLNNPLHERLGHNGPSVLDAEVLGERRDVVLGGAGGDAVNHGVGESALLGDPLGKLRVAELGEGHQHVAGDGTVLLHVVAGQNSEGLEAIGVTPGQGSVEEAECADRGVFVLLLDIVLDIGVLVYQLMGILVVVVATLSNSERDDMGIGVSHLGDNGLAVIGGKDEGVDAADDVGEAALCGALDDCVEVVLGVQDIAHGSIVGSQADTADGPIALAMLLEQLVDVDGQMGSVETADTDVDDALLEGLAVVGGDLHLLVSLL